MNNFKKYTKKNPQEPPQHDNIHDATIYVWNRHFQYHEFSLKENDKLHVLTSEKTVLFNLIGIIAIWFWTFIKIQHNFHTF